MATTMAGMDSNANNDIQTTRGGYDLAQEVTGLKRGTLHAKVSQGRIPHRRLGPRLVVFDRAELVF